MGMVRFDYPEVFTLELFLPLFCIRSTLASEINSICDYHSRKYGIYIHIYIYMQFGQTWEYCNYFTRTYNHRHLRHVFSCVHRQNTPECYQHKKVKNRQNLNNEKSWFVQGI